MTRSHTLAVFTGMVAVFTAQRRPLSRQGHWPFSPEYPKYKDALIVNFLWDCTRGTQEHTKFKEGVLKINGINGCVVVSAPSTMDGRP